MKQNSESLPLFSFPLFFIASFFFFGFSKIASAFLFTACILFLVLTVDTQVYWHDGRPFYHHAATRTTQWEAPEEQPADAAAEAQQPRAEASQ